VTKLPLSENIPIKKLKHNCTHEGKASNAAERLTNGTHINCQQ